LQPGEEIALTLRVNCPKIPARYILEIDMVQEMVTWFSQSGATQTARLPITVREGLYRKMVATYLGTLRPEKRSNGEVSWEPSMTMNGIPRVEVVPFVQDHGGSVLEVVEQDRTGRRWTSFNYWVTK